MDRLAEDGKAWGVEFARQARPFSVRWRRGRLRARSGRSLPWAVGAAVGLLALLRLTLVDLPEDPAIFLLIPFGWLLSLALSYALDRPRLAPLAQAIDRALDLDERLGTAVALAAVSGEAGPQARLVRRQRLDALRVLEARGGDAARLFKPRLRVPRVALALAAGLAVIGGGLLVVHSSVAEQRSERTALRAATAATVARLAAARRVTVARPNLPAAPQQAAVTGLAAAVTALQTHPDDRAANVAALSQAEDSLRGTLPTNFAQVSAARKAAARDLENSLTSFLDTAPVGDTELDRAAAALETTAGELVQAGAGGRTSQLAVAGSLDRVATELAGTDAALAQQMRDTATTLRQPGGDVTAPLGKLADALRATGQEQAGTDLLTGTLAQLADSRGQIAQAGLATAAGAAPGTASLPLGRLRPPASGAGLDGPNAAGSRAGSGPGSGSGGDNAAGAGGAGQPGQSAGGKAGGAGTGGGSSNLNANVQGGGGGAAGGGANPSGTGTGRGTAGKAGPVGTDSGSDEQLYVPAGGTVTLKPGGVSARVPGSQSPGQGGPETGVVQRGPGTNPGAKTPFSRVIGTYRDAAAQSLDHSYIPPDAKTYVRDYFDSLVTK